MTDRFARVASPALALSALALLAGCPAASGPRHPAPHADPFTVEIGRDAASLRSVAASPEGARTFAAFALADVPARTPPRSVVESYVRGKAERSILLHGTAGPMATSGALVALALAGTGDLGPKGDGPLFEVRGEPGAALVALVGMTGEPRWRLALDANEWVVVSSLAGTDDGFVIGGSFSGSLRIANTVVTSAAKSDGFVARVRADGTLAWLVRVGGPGADAVQGVAVRGDRIAIAGTFAGGADLLGAALPAFDENSPFADGFVGVLDGEGRRVWSSTFGGKQAETIAGVAIDDHGNVAVAGSARGVVHVAGADLVANGPADGLVAWWDAKGTAQRAVLVGGSDVDDVRAIVAVGDHIVVGGVYAGTIDLGTAQLVAGGGDGAFVATFDHRGAVIAAFDVAGAGREEIVGLAAMPQAVLAGVAHTADATITGAALPSPKDPLTGAALVVRDVR
jgi:hypothetical protein